MTLTDAILERRISAAKTELLNATTRESRRAACDRMYELIQSRSKRRWLEMAIDLGLPTTDG